MLRGVAFLAFLAAQASDGFSPALQRIRTDIARLASPELMGRGREGKKLAADWIAAAWRKAGIRPWKGDDFSIPILDTDGREIGRNLLASLPGSDPALRAEFVILSAHYDHLGKRGDVIFPGADDNASGVAALLEASRSLAAARPAPRRTVLLAAFDLEEGGLKGSYDFVARAPVPIDRIAAFLTADMVGRDTWDFLPKHLFLIGAEFSPEVRDFASGLPRDGFTLAQIGADLIGSRSDYAAFRDEEVPFLFLSSGEHRDYHRPTDTAEKIDLGKVELASRVMVAFARRFGDAETKPRFAEDQPTSLEELQAIRRILGILLEKAPQLDLSVQQLGSVQELSSKLDGWIKKGSLSGEDRAELVRQVQLLMLGMRMR